MSSYRINDIFYSLQGEGRNTGRAAVFIRFAGCNLRCPFCDTEFDSYREMSGEDILQAISTYESRFVVLTGGEPTLQVDEAFVDLLHRHGYEVAMESNGTRPAPKNLDWLTVSPKGGIPSTPCSLPPTPKKMKEGAEGKLPAEITIVFEDEDTLHQLLKSLPLPLEGAGVRLQGAGMRFFLQPCDTGDAARNKQIVAACVDYVKRHPVWRLSLQTHKLIGIE